MAEVPITREFLANHYRKHPAPALSEELLQRLQELQEVVRQLAAHTPRNDSLVKEWTVKIPKRIDENLFRNREQCEEISFLVRPEALDEFMGKLSAMEGTSSSRIEGIRSSLAEVGEIFLSSFKYTEEWQKNNVARIEAEVKKMLPNDWRMRMVQKKRDKKEKRFQKALAELEASGGTIGQKYDMLWDQQMGRRAQLVKLGNASGIMRWVLTKLGGVPPVMLDFVKTINDEEGPLEETRVRYCPNLITLLRLANNIHVLLACVVKNVEDFKMDGEQGVEELVELVLQSSRMHSTEFHSYLEFMKVIMEDSPFFLTKKDALSSTVVDHTGGPHHELIVHSRTVEEINFSVEHPGSLLVYEFSTKKNDIGFGLRLVREDLTFTELLECHRYECSKTPVQRELVLDQPGHYCVLFDNSFSRFTKKVVSYRLALLPPADVQSQSAEAGGSASASTSKPKEHTTGSDSNSDSDSD